MLKQTDHISSESKGRILFIGSVMLDTICHVERLPKPGEGIVSETFSSALGGCAYNSARAIRHLGGSCTLMAPVGRGPSAEAVRIMLAQQGIKPWNIESKYDNGTAICLILPDGERTMITLPGIDRHYEQAWFSQVDVSSHSAASVDGYLIETDGGYAIISFLEEHPSLRLYFAPGPRICSLAEDKIKRINALRPIWHLNKQEALTYTQESSLLEAGWRLLEQCRNAVVITDGKDGSHLFEMGRHLWMQSEPVPVRDTVGAGDAHIGVLMALREQGYSWEDALAKANAYSALVCQTSGATLSDDLFETNFAL